MGKLSVREITNFNDFLSLENEWNELVEKSQNDTIFLRHEWFKIWWRSFGRGKKLLILLFMDDSQLIGIVPLMSVKERFRGLPIKSVKFIENDNSPRSDFILKEKKKEVMQCFITHLGRKKNSWDAIVLRNIPKEKRSYEILREVLKEKRILYGIKNGLCSPYLQPNWEWETFLSGISSKVSKTIRNNRNRVKRLGDVSIKEYSKIEPGSKIIKQLFCIGRKSWKDKIGNSISSTAGNREFFRELSVVASRNGWLSIWLLRANGEAIAFEYHLKYKDKRHALRSEFDEQYRKFSPGSALDSFIVEDIFLNDRKEYDMGGCTDAYKMKWTSTVREHSNIYIFNDRLYSTLLYFLEFSVGNFFRRAKALIKEGLNFQHRSGS